MELNEIKKQKNLCIYLKIINASVKRKITAITVMK